ncbi:hypothetical protein BaRGS_00038659 [Batillaria attramentaria]|uniref:PiggyBac transposable element-derived protein domain-containing protein n=1 Tax=Batillaria attramentaria TaxID=370345 RepID=A0ABD0J5U0_9CAEN
MIDTGKTDNNQPVMKPKVVHLYNQNMNGLDNFDQNIQYYSFNRKTWKWWKRAAFHLLHLAKVQSFLVFKMFNPNWKKSQKEFTLDVILHLTEGSTPPKIFMRRVSDPPERLKEKHFLTLVQSSGKKKYPVLCVL